MLRHISSWVLSISTSVLSDQYFGTLCLVLRYSLIIATTLSVSASAFMPCAMTLQYYIVSSGTYCVVSYSFISTGLGIPIVI